MVKLAALVIATGAGIATYGWASAADLLPPAPALPSEPSSALEFSGWYLRGDVGLGFAAGAPDLPDPIDAGVLSGFLSSAAYQHFNNTTRSQSAMIDFGVGYQ